MNQINKTEVKVIEDESMEKLFKLPFSYHLRMALPHTIFVFTGVVIMLLTRNATDLLIKVELIFSAIVFFVLLTHFALGVYRFHVIRKYSEGPKFMNALLDMAVEIEEAAKQVCPENYSLKEAVSLMYRIGSKYYNKMYDNEVYYSSYMIYIVPRLKELYGALLKYDSVKSYVLTSTAADKKIRKKYSDIFNAETGKYLEEMDKALVGNIETTDEHKYQEEHVRFLKKVFSEYAEENKDAVEQLNYNMKQLYPLLRQRKKERLKANYEKWLSSTLLPEKQ